MNTLTAYSMTDPFGRVSECIQFTIDDPNMPFVLKDIMSVGLQYTFSLWLLSETNGSVSVRGETFDSMNAWDKRFVTFTAYSTDLLIYFNEPGNYYVFHPQLEIGNKVTDWTPAPEDMATSEAVENVKSMLLTTNETIANLSVASDNISAEVTRIETSTKENLDALDADVSSLTAQVAAKVSADDVAITVKSELANGTKKVVTETGYTFDETGLTVEKSGSEMKTQISENGMTVYQDNEAVLTANNSGVDAKNLHATTYLIVGKNSRFEDYGENRTGCFWIGG